MRRVLLAVEDVELAVELVGALEEKNHLVEHLFDLTEALLRAEITRPDLLVIDLARLGVDHGLLRRWAAQNRVPIVLTSMSSAGERLARQMGATYVRRPASARRDDDAPDSAAWSATFVDVVETAIANARPATPSSFPFAGRSRSGTMAKSASILVAAAGPTARDVVASFIANELGLRCESVAEAEAAARRLHEDFQGPRVQAVLLDMTLLRDRLWGDELAHALRASGVPVIPLRLFGDEPSSVGQAVWDAMPALRDAIAAAKSRSA
jgi:DNA-binding response OmpR family regulator